MRIRGWIAFAACMLMGAGAAMAAEGQPKVMMFTNLGEIEIELDAQHAPRTTANFLRYVKDGFYDGTVFHRVIPRFMIQGGGFTPELRKKSTHAPIVNEADNGLKNVAGSIAMARTGDPHSATSQFFINTNNNSFLDHTMKTSRGWGYAVFGKVVRGMPVVRQIESVATGRRHGMGDVPQEPIVIRHVEVIE